MYHKIVLPNGVRVVTDPISHLHTASVGIWVGNGSRFEPAEVGGISHFIEHMIFKGTEKRSAKHIAIAFDALGGQVNAFTTKEFTCYYMKVLDEKLQTGVSILADMFMNSLFRQEDIDMERGVVLEEIDMYEDSPEDVATEKLFESCFADSALGRPILGAEETLSSMTGDTLHQYMRDYYRPKDTIIAISGRFTQTDLDYICNLFSSMTGEGRNVITPAVYHPSVTTRTKEIEQNHIAIGFPGLCVSNPDRYAYQIMNAIIGGGMSSRLFQSVREQNGLCYSIYSYTASHTETGMFSIYTALNQPLETKAIDLILQELARFRDEGPSRDELSRCREQLKTTLLMSLESTSARMNHIGRSEMVYSRVIPPEEIVERYNAVTEKDVQRVAQQILRFEDASLCAVGECQPPDFYRELLQKNFFEKS